MGQIMSTIATCISAALVAFFVWRGLSAWKGQFIGKKKYEAAEDLNKAVIAWRDSIYNMRGRNEYAPFTEEEAPGASDALKDYLGLARYRAKQNETRNKARTNVYAAVLTAEVLIGKEIRALVDEISILDGRLSHAIGNDLILQDPGKSEYPDKEDARASLQTNKNKELLWYSGSDDHFVKELEAIISQLEDILRPCFDIKD